MEGNPKVWLRTVLLSATVLTLAACGAVEVPVAAAPPSIWSQAPTPEPITTWSQAPAPKEPTLKASPPESTPPPVLESPSEAPAPEVRPSTSVPDKTIAPSPGKGAVLTQLQTIKVKGRAPKTGYERALFGKGWKDPDRNGCDARNDILRRDLTNLSTRPGTQGCMITSGVLDDPFTGVRIDFVRGQGTSMAVQIDHLVPLSDAWQKGAQQLSEDQRLEFANDPLNLLAVDGPSNASKGDSDAATWLPPRKSFRCVYVARQTAVKAKYGLWMTRAEHDAIGNILSSQCPEQQVPAG
ncbi:HNH endonuclease family protein [Paeniglutamicibacter antarcticus]|uniref:HNH endonuclease family protein n=1 Tax=Paeniglutamicibacter antarcticus TaxID=494023 RepID=UPI0031EA785B